MKLPAALGVALASMTMAAYAQPETRVFINRGAIDLEFDANHDGWLSRSEMSAAADRLFASLDTNHDGRLNRDDRPQHEDIDVHVEIPGHPDMPPPPDVEALMHGENCTTTVEPAPQASEGESGRRIERRVTVICRDEESGDAPQAEEGRHVERRVVIMRHGDGDAPEAVAPVPPVPPVPPVAPLPPHGPAFMMLFADSSEADRNNDGALSQDEFRRQQLRFFDASDANGDGRIRFTPPPAPHAAPTPPAPPSAPTPPPR